MMIVELRRQGNGKFQLWAFLGVRISPFLPIQGNDKFYLAKWSHIYKIVCCIIRPTVFSILTWNAVVDLEFSFTLNVLCFAVFFLSSSSNLNLHFLLKHQFGSSGLLLLLLSFFLHWVCFSEERRGTVHSLIEKKGFSWCHQSCH